MIDIVNNKNINSKCLKHHKSFRYICITCNHLLCSSCKNQHIKYYNSDNITLDEHHQCFHIDQVRDTLSTLGYGSSSSSSSNSNNIIKNYKAESHFNGELDEIWNFIKKSTNQIQTLETKHDQISNYFRRMHEYLILQEHKITKPIIKDIDEIKVEINYNITQLQSIINIINQSNNNERHNNNNNENHKSKTKDDDTYNVDQYDSLNNDDDNSWQNRESSSFTLEDNYSIDSIVDIIKACETLNQFIISEDHTLFRYNEYEFSGYKENLKNNIDLIILDLLYKHNIQFNNFKDYIKEDNDKSIISNNNNIINNKNRIENKNNSSSNNNDKIQYHDKWSSDNVSLLNKIYFVSINTESEQLIKDLIMQSIQLSTSFIFSIHSTGSKASILNITDGSNVTVVEDITIDYNCENTSNSVVRVGDNIYIFGGLSYSTPEKYSRYGVQFFTQSLPLNEHQYAIYSILKKKIVHKSKIDSSIEPGSHISVAYDGNNYIYLIGGDRSQQSINSSSSTNNTNKDRAGSIDRYNITTRKFEHYHWSEYYSKKNNYSSVYPSVYSKNINYSRIMLLSFFYKGLIYSVPSGGSNILIFNPKKKTVDEYGSKDLIALPIGACTDGCGNVYILSGDGKFIRFNVDTKEIKNLTPIIGSRYDFFISMVCQNIPSALPSSSSNTSKIYALGGYLNYYNGSSISCLNHVYSTDNDKWANFLSHDRSKRMNSGSSFFN